MLSAPPTRSTSTSRALDLYLATSAVVGQEVARKQMAVLLERQWQVAEGRYAQAPGAIIGGRSGSGKTMLARLACRACGLPFADDNATRYTEAGYAGLDLSQMFLKLLASAARMKDAREAESRRTATAPILKAGPPSSTAVLRRDDIDEVVKIAENGGVVLLDEFDKWMLRLNHVTGQQEKTIQADLLKLVEGSVEYISDTEGEIGISFDTSKVLILCAGAFVALEGIVGRRLSLEPDERTRRYPVALWDHITQEDFIRYGLLPELAGRLSTHIFLRPLEPAALTEILTGLGGIADEYRQRFESIGCQWAVPEEGIRQVAATAMERDTGARAVEHVMWTVFADALYQASVSEEPVRVTFQPMWAKARVEAA